MAVEVEDSVVAQQDHTGLSQRLDEVWQGGCFLPRTGYWIAGLVVEVTAVDFWELLMTVKVPSFLYSSDRSLGTRCKVVGGLAALFASGCAVCRGALPISPRLRISTHGQGEVSSFDLGSTWNRTCERLKEASWAHCGP
ncbi:hypothetical protein TREES_T100013404 [Tupaia chinensis]|uniref:Uncharacterized protein n=1 Tax=Tupaia chinensis TaxID=246437 RepID=L9JFX4_TUPCH|nr:hypothetical protein TREES_T100013404 [Tupaia chinensis]